MARDTGRSPIGEALTWVSRITVIGITMALPAAGGSWLDHRLGTTVLGPTGLVLGFAAGIVSIVRLAGERERRR
jgi:F0F1-type ATP synthase assembly protein I